VARLRRGDPLLSYLKNARGAEDHTVQEIAEKRPGGIGINPAEGNTLYIEEMTVFDGVIRVKSPHSIRIDILSGKLKLVPVRNRGRLYDVPTEHLGNELPDQEPTTLAEYGISFLENYLSNAEREFVK
jgi:hypothetical protein